MSHINFSLSIPKKEEFDIIVCGGANDQIPENFSNLVSGMEAFIAYCKTNYKNAAIHIGHFTNSIAPNLVDKFLDSVTTYKTVCAEEGAKYIENSQYVMQKLSFFNTDNVHPSATGITALEKYLAAYLVNGYFDVIESATGTLANGTNATVSNDRLLQQQINGVIGLKFNSGGSFVKITPNSSLAIGVGRTHLQAIAKFSDGFLIPNTSNNITINAILFDDVDFCATADVYCKTIAASKYIEIGIFIFSTASKTVSEFALMAGATSVIPYS